MAKIPAFTGSGKVGQALITACRSRSDWLFSCTTAAPGAALQCCSVSKSCSELALELSVGGFLNRRSQVRVLPGAFDSCR